jgi:hypothetical protein
MQKDGRDWAAVRREYEEGPLTVAEISARWGIPQTTIRDRARQDGWRMRSERPSQPRNRGAGLLNQLYLAVAQGLDEIGTLGPDRSAADRERDTRTLASLVKLSEKIVQLEKQARDKAAGTVEWTQEYRDRKREELAQRVIRMLEQIRGAPLPEGPE